MGASSLGVGRVINQTLVDELNGQHTTVHDTNIDLAALEPSKNGDLTRLSDLEEIGLRDIEVVEPLGSGSTAEVFLIKARIEGEVAYFALKIFHALDPNLACQDSSDDVVSLFAQTELTAQRIRSLATPEQKRFLAKVLGVFKVKDRLAVLMPYYPGGTLGNVIENMQGPDAINVSLINIAEVSEQLAIGLSAYHKPGESLNEDDRLLIGEQNLQRPTVHRDLKPENVYFAIVNGQLEVKIGDHTLIQETDQNGTIPTPSSGKLLGTPGYAALETVRLKESDQKFRVSADIYSLGVILLQLLNGGKNPYINNSGQLPTFTLHLQQTRTDVADKLQNEIDPRDLGNNDNVIELDRPEWTPNVLRMAESRMRFDLLDLARSMTSLQPNLRPTAQEVAVKLREIISAYEEKCSRSVASILLHARRNGLLKFVENLIDPAGETDVHQSLDIERRPPAMDTLIPSLITGRASIG